jgi:hypothetical protein
VLTSQFPAPAAMWGWPILEFQVSKLSASQVRLKLAGTRSSVAPHVLRALFSTIGVLSSLCESSQRTSMNKILTA